MAHTHKRRKSTPRRTSHREMSTQDGMFQLFRYILAAILIIFAMMDIVDGKLYEAATIFLIVIGLMMVQLFHEKRAFLHSIGILTVLVGICFRIYLIFRPHPF